MKRRYTTTDGQVISLMCARFEDALAEGRTDAVVTEHAAECVRCHMMLTQIQGEQGALAAVATASGPVQLPSGFTEGVLARALPPERYLKEPTQKAHKFTWWHHGITGIAAGICTALLIWAGTDTMELVNTEEASNTPVAVSQAEPDATVEGVLHLLETENMMEGLTIDESLSRMLAFEDEAKVPPAVAVPEARMDLPQELKLAVLRQVQRTDACPKRLRKPVRVTLTVRRDGSLSNRTVFSASGQSKAHDCVNEALDALALPPMTESANITLDIAW